MTEWQPTEHETPWWCHYIFRSNMNSKCVSPPPTYGPFHSLSHKSRSMQSLINCTKARAVVYCFRCEPANSRLEMCHSSRICVVLEETSPSVWSHPRIHIVSFIYLGVWKERFLFILNLLLRCCRCRSPVLEAISASMHRASVYLVPSVISLPSNVHFLVVGVETM